MALVAESGKKGRARGSEADLAQYVRVGGSEKERKIFLFHFPLVRGTVGGVSL